MTMKTAGAVFVRRLWKCDCSMDCERNGLVRTPRPSPLKSTEANHYSLFALGIPGVTIAIGGAEACGEQRCLQTCTVRGLSPFTFREDFCLSAAGWCG